MAPEFIVAAGYRRWTIFARAVRTILLSRSR